MFRQRIFGVFILAMINVAAITSLRNLSIVVEYGFSAISYYLLAALCFFIPTALVCAELTTTWPQSGGLYRWVSEAFGKKVGFFAIWVSWMLTVSWFPAVLTFTAGMLAYLFNPDLIHNKWFMVGVMLSVYWGATFINFLGLKFSGWISSIGVILGTIFPGVLIIALGMIWLYMGKPLQIQTSVAHLVPHFGLQNMVFFAGVLLAFAGMEMSTYHSREALNPQHDYPRAIFMASIIILFIMILGSLAISFVVPKEEISLFAGLMQAFKMFFEAFNMAWMVPVIATFAVIGSLAGINTWIIGPAKGILTAAEDGFLPPALQKINEQGMPVGTMIFQAVVGSILAIVFFFMPSVNSAFWIITALTIQFAMIMYILIFAAGIYLRFSQPHQHRPYKIPGKNWGMILVAGVGILICAFGFVISFVPPAQMDTGQLLFYVSFLMGGFVLLSLIPLVFIKIRQPHWVAKVHHTD